MEEKQQLDRAGGGDKGKGGRPQVAVDLMDREPEAHHMIPVWFFVGGLLFLYGLIILGTGIYELSHPPSTVLAELRPALWWGTILTVIGGVYVYLFLPRKS